MERYCTFWRRFFAFFIDGLVLLPIAVFEIPLRSADSSSILLFICAVVTFGVYGFYGVVMHGSYGQTVGKMATGVKVLKVSEKEIPSYLQSVLRDILIVVLHLWGFIVVSYLIITGQYSPNYEFNGTNSAISSLLATGILGWYVVEILSMLTNKKRRALHDFIAGTVVIRTAP